ncbi:MAG TPA: vWA domain-containing protein [Gaiellaceae bacterium]|nr:vWA domain-containing protein [Gaiellaceae bacterium]
MRLATVSRRGAIPLAGLPELGNAARRTSVGRLALAFALAATLTGLVLVSRSAGTGRAAVFPEGTNTGVVVLDMSASIAGPIYARVATTLKGIVAANQSIGLVMFSDTPYRLLPANSPPGALLQFIRFFIPTGFSGGSPLFAQSPWDNFSGGTRIADGLAMGRRSLALAHVKHGALLLVSDLDDAASDEPALYAEAQKLRDAHIPVRIVPLFANPANLRLFSALFGANAFVKTNVFTHTAKRHAQAVSGSEPWLLITLGFVLVLLLAGNERWNGRFVAKVAT